MNHRRNFITESSLWKFQSINFGYFEKKCLMLKFFIFYDYLIYSLGKKKKLLRVLFGLQTVAYEVVSVGKQMLKHKPAIQTIHCLKMPNFEMLSFILNSTVPMNRLFDIHRNWYLNLEVCPSVWVELRILYSLEVDKKTFKCHLIPLRDSYPLQC